jgi:hypothetical protein
MTDPRRIRRIGVGFLLLGSAIVTSASVLPWAQMEPSTPSVAWSNSFNSFAFFQEALERGEIVAALISWAPSFWLAVVAVAALLDYVKRGWEPRIFCLFWTLIGAFFVCSSAWLFLHPLNEPAGNVGTLDCGLSVALVGYGCAFVGACCYPLSRQQRRMRLREHTVAERMR